MPVVKFPSVSMSSIEADTLPVGHVRMPQMSSMQHTMHVKKYKKALTARTEIMTSMLQKAFKDVDFQASPPPEPDSPPLSTTIDGYRLCVSAFCSDIHVLIQNFGEARTVIQDEQERLMATLLHLLGFRPPPAAEPAMPYRMLATLDLTSLRPVFATDRASQLVASLEGDTRWESDVELLRNTWDVLVAYMNQHVKTQMYYLGSFLGSVQKLLDETPSAKPETVRAAERKKRREQREEEPVETLKIFSQDIPHRVMFDGDPDPGSSASVDELQPFH